MKTLKEEVKKIIVYGKGRNQPPPWFLMYLKNNRGLKDFEHLQKLVKYKKKKVIKVMSL